MSTGSVDERFLITRNADTFLRRLAPGDILLLDSMRVVSHLIKLSENAPVNHAALYAGDGEYIHVSPPYRGKPAVTRGSVREWLATGVHRTVTALRHGAIDKGNLRPGEIVRRAQQMVDDEDQYALVDLISLVIPTFWRTYHKNFEKETERTREPAQLFDFLSRNLLADIERVAADRTVADAAREDAMTLTCSELVYLSYDRTEPGCIELFDPLARWPAAAQGDTDGASDDSALPEPEARPFTLLSALPLLARGESNRFRPGSRDMVLLADRAVRALTGQAQHNLEVGKYIERDVRPGAPLSDCVTPGDLYRSPSLRPVVVFHLPPARSAAAEIG